MQTARSTPGRITDRYRIVRTLGEGAAGKVYWVRDEAREADVALKLLSHRGLTAAQAERFRHEFALLSTLVHPNLARAYDFGRSAAGYYYTAELVDGLPLDGYLRKHRTLPAALRVAAEVLAALDHLHRQGLTHGDLHPRNILCSPQGVKLIDFGLADGASPREDLRQFGRAFEDAVGPVLKTDRRLGELIERLTTDVPGRAFPDAVTGLSLLGVTPAALPCFVGREDELRRARQARVALVHGEEGCGKSALIEKLRVAAQLDEIVVGVGRPSLRPLGTIVQLFAELSSAGVDPRLIARSHANGLELRIALTRSLMQAARKHRLLVVFEDLHALDPDSFSLAVHFAEALPLLEDVQARVLLTWRDAELAAARRTADVARLKGEDLRLGPLDVDRVAAARLQGVPSADLVLELRRATEGNATLLDALLSARSAFVERDGAWHAAAPLEVRVRSDFEELRGDARELAVMFAATPGTLERRTLERFFHEDSLATGLVYLIRMGWIRPAGADRWAIASAIRRRAVPEGEKARVHAALGRALESFGGKPDFERLAALAHHFAAAGDGPKARYWARRYGASCERRHAYAEAAETYERCTQDAGKAEALEFLELARKAWESAANFPRMVEVARRQVEVERTGETLFRLAEALRAHGKLPEAIQGYREAADALVADPERRTEALCEVATVHATKHALTEMSGILDEATACCPALLAKHVLAKLLRARAILACLKGDFEAGLPLLDAAVRAARESGDRMLVWRTLHAGIVLRDSPNPHYWDSEHYLIAAATSAKHSGYHLEAAISRAGLAQLDEVRGSLRETTVLLPQIIDSAIQAGQWMYAGQLATSLAFFHLQAGRGDTAMSAARLGEKLAAMTGDNHAASYATAWSSMALALRGEIGGALTKARAALQLGEQTQDPYASKAHIQAEAFARWEAGIGACRQLADTFEWFLKSRSPVDGAAFLVMAVSQGALSTGAVAEALSFLRVWRNPIGEARVRCALALCYLREGRPQEARKELASSKKLAPDFEGLEALDIQRWLLFARLAEDPRKGASMATRAYHAALGRGRLRLAEEAAELIGDLAMKGGNVQRAAHWYHEARRVFDDRRKTCCEAPEMNEYCTRRGQALDGKINQAESAPAQTGWLRRLLELDAEMMSSTSLQPLLRKIMDAMIEMTGAERGFLLLAGGGRWKPAVCRNLDRMDLNSQDFRISMTVAERVLKSGKTFTCADAQEDEQLRATASVRAGRLRSILCLPLADNGKPVGVVYLDNRHRAAAFEAIDLSLTEMFRERAAMAIRHAQLVEQARNATRRSKQIAEKMAPTKPVRLHDKGPAISTSPRHPAFAPLVGSSRALEQAVRVLEKAAQTDAPVLLLGETGTGKELAARGLHEASARAREPFVPVNCAALPPSVLESELFGHVRGAFTGAERDKSGLFQAANGGTLFLDEIGEMSTDLQAKLLRALQEREVRKVGATVSLKVDVRIIAASNRDLQRLVKGGTFREDLYYRLKRVVVVLPPLRDRREDIPALIHEFLRRAEKKHGPRKLAPEAAALLIDYGWPGNVRELEGVIESCVLLSDRAIGAALVSQQLKVPSVIEGDSLDLGSSLAKTERALITKAIETSVSLAEACRKLGIARAQLYRLMERHGLKPKAFGRL